MFFNVRQRDLSSKPHFARKGLAKIEIAREKKNHQDRNIYKINYFYVILKQTEVT